MISSLRGRVYSITGAASGIGRATALKIANSGAAAIALSDVDEKRLEETKALCAALENDIRISTTRVDVSDDSSVTSWINNLMTEFGRLDGCANVAGIAGGDGSTTVQTLAQRDWDRMMDVNLKGTMHCLRAQLPHLPRPGGSIVNVASTAGIHGLPKSAAYSSSKHGVIGLTSSAAGEFGRDGIRINSLLPGPIDTRIFRDGEAKGLFDANVMGGATLLGRMGQAAEVANVVCFLLSDQASYVTGARWTVDGGYSAC